MSTSHDRRLLSSRDPVWIWMGLALLVFAALVLVEINIAPTYLDVRPAVEGYSIDWDEPQRVVARFQTSEGWPARYFVLRRTAEVCLLDDGTGPDFETGLSSWASSNNWEIGQASIEPSCGDYAALGVPLEEQERGWVTLKPLGWDEGQEWNATLCLAPPVGEPCGQMTVVSIVPSFGVMIGNQ